MFHGSTSSNGTRRPLQRALDAFGSSRLLAFDRDAASRGPTVEVSHEALLREWPLLRGWLRESRGEVRLQRQLSLFATEWTTANRDPSFLLTGARLTQFEAWRANATVALTADERALIDASLAERERRAAAEAERVARELALQRRARRILQALLVVFLSAAVIAGGLAWWANVERTNAQTQAAILLAQQAENEVENGNPDRAVLLALEALTRYPYTAQAEHALGQAVTLGRAERFLAGHTSTVGGVAWSADGARVATASTDHTVRIWDVATGMELRRADANNQAYSVAWSPDGSTLFFATGDRFLYDRGNQGVDVFRWDLDDPPALLYHAPEYPLNDAQGVQNGNAEKLMVAENTSHSIATSPSGDRLALIADHGVIVIDLKDPDEILTLSGHTDLVYSVAWSPDETRLLTAGADQTARIWDARDGRLLRTIDSIGQVVTAAVWSPDGTGVALSTRQRSVVIFAADTGYKLMSLNATQGPVWDLAWSPDGAYLATADESGAILVWSVEKGEVAFTLRGHDTRAVSVAWSPDGRHLASGSKDSTAYVWRATKGVELLAMDDPSGLVTELGWSPDGRTILSAGGTWLEYGVIDGQIREWDVTTGHEIRALEPALDAYYEVEVSPDGKYLATHHDSQFPGNPNPLFDAAFVWDYASGEVITVIPVIQTPDEGFLYDMAWAPDSRRLVVASSQGIARVYDALSGERLVDFTEQGPTHVVSGVDWSPTGAWIASTDLEAHLIRVWNATTGEERYQLAHNSAPRFPRWSPTGDRLCTPSGDIEVGGSDNVIRIWDDATGQLVRMLRGHVGAVWVCKWMPNGQRIISTSQDGTTRMWNVATGAELLRLPTPTTWFLTASISPQGTYLATAGNDGTIRLWRVWQTTQELIDYARDCCVIRDLTAKEIEQFGLSGP